MRFLLKAAAVAFIPSLATPLTTATPASAFGDTCYRDVRATGSVQGSMSSARNAAISAWENAASRRHGAGFANWYYSVDRTFECSWDNSGRRIRCVAIAAPCGRKL